MSEWVLVGFSHPVMVTRPTCSVIYWQGDSNVTRNDLAIIQLREPIPLHMRGRIQFACLQAPNSPSMPARGVVVGWGQLTSLPLPRAIHLQHAPVSFNQTYANESGCIIPGVICTFPTPEWPDVVIRQVS